MSEALSQLAELLEKRLVVIADHELRENDPGEQLKQLQTVSEKIVERQGELAGELSPRLAHFLDNCSYDKALAWIREGNS